MNAKTKIASSVICSVGAIIAIIMVDYQGEIRTSKAGLEIIGNAEGCRRDPYLCPANVLTVGIGSTGKDIGQKIYSDDEIAKRWVSDIKTAEGCVNRYGNGFNLPQPVFDAATSITFNAGCGNMRASTMFKCLNSGDFKRACSEFPRWNKAGGKVLDGLIKRRKVEFNLCMEYTQR